MIVVIKLKKTLAVLVAILAVICILTSIIIQTVSQATTISGSDKDSSNYVSIPIVMYHKLLKDKSKSGKHTITPEQFENDLKYLKENGYTTIVMEDVIKYVYEGKELPTKPIVLTFDDGFYNNYYYGFELLEKYNMKAVLSIVGAYSEQCSNPNEENPNYSYVTWDRTNYIASSGIFEIQNHTYDLHNSSTAGIKRNLGESLEKYRIRITKDISKLQEKIFETTGVYPNTFAYPFGAVSEGSTQILKDMGFLATFSCTSGVNKIYVGDYDCLFLLKRNNRPSSISTENFFKKIEKNISDTE